MQIRDRGWHDWLTVDEQKKRFGRQLTPQTDFIAVLTGNTAVFNAQTIGAYFNNSGTIGFSIPVGDTALPKDFLLGYMIVMTK